jgi:hypothetical protein
MYFCHSLLAERTAILEHVRHSKNRDKQKCMEKYVFETSQKISN